MSEILYQRTSRSSTDNGLLHPVVQEIRSHRNNPEQFDRMVLDFIHGTDLLPIPEKIRNIGRLTQAVREAAEAWDLIVTVSARRHCILIEAELDEMRDLTFLCDLTQFADHVTFTDDAVPIVQIRYFTYGFCRNGEFL